MKNISKRATRYIAAAGAFVAGGHMAEASVNQGVVIGDKFLDQHLDLAVIDLDDNSSPDFVMYMFKSSYSYYSYSYIYAGVILYGMSSGAYVGLDSGSWYWAKNYGNGDVIGPLTRPNYAAAVMGNNFYWSSSFAGSDAVQNNPGFGNIGVSIIKGGNTHYGFIQLYTDQVNYTVELFNAFYESTPDEPIVSKSADTVPLLPLASGLGIGIIGLFGLLKKRKQLYI
ncbi:MAG: hypothetical protein JXR50_08660 [Prolixibacteraceae bacterium]|nr:hypothetical protein [Prolixibacteraceae bacterium]MBN2649796.1 hypothetical protein [Prolixibacteraceae bacterium]